MPEADIAPHFDRVTLDKLAVLNARRAEVHPEGRSKAQPKRAESLQNELTRRDQEAEASCVWVA